MSLRSLEILRKENLFDPTDFIDESEFELIATMGAARLPKRVLVSKGFLVRVKLLATANLILDGLEQSLLFTL